MKCRWRACPYPATVDRECRYHSTFFNYPVSLTGRHISIGDMYDAENPNGTALYMATAWELQSPKSIYSAYRPVKSMGDSDPYRDLDWGFRLAKAQAEISAKNYRRSLRSVGSANGLTAAEVVMPSGAVISTVQHIAENRQQTGAFVLWKGFGKKKIRKSQRNRPAGWHGNHPDQKPRDKWGTRETLDDIPKWVPQSAP